MALFDLNDTQVGLLAACLTVGFEGISTDEETHGVVTTDDDFNAISALLDELAAIANRGGAAEITILSDVPATNDPKPTHHSRLGNVVLEVLGEPKPINQHRAGEPPANEPSKRWAIGHESHQCEETAHDVYLRTGDERLRGVD